MSQVTNFVTPGTPLTMAGLKTFVDACFAAVASANRGATAPSSPFEGMTWWDTSGNPVEVLKRYTVTAGWVSMLSVNITSGLYTVMAPTITSPIISLGSDADGDMWFRASGAMARLAKGTAYQGLGMNAGATAPAWMASLQSLMTAQGDIVYASAANTPARLAKGTANYGLFMNAGATAPEWAKGMVIKNFTRDMTAGSGDVSYTGFNFKPGLVLIFANVVNTQLMSIGMWDGTTHMLIMDNWSFSNDTYYSYTDKCIYMYGGSGSQSAVGKTMDSDGLTVTYTKASSPTGTANIMIAAWR